MSTTSKSMLATLNIIYLALVTMMTLFGAVVFYLNTSGTITGDSSLTAILRYVLFAVAITGLSAGFFLFKSFIGNNITALTLHQKLMKYQVAMLVRAACFEMPGLFASVVALITGDNSFLLFTAVIIVLFFLFRPSLESISSDLNLSRPEINQLENPNTVL